jgi:hypothetical protein
VPTYESVGLYWTAPGANAATGCEVKFRKVGDATWRQGLAMWFDARDNQCRGSLVQLAPATNYEVQFNLPGVAASRGLTFSTWSNSLPVARTVTVNSSTPRSTSPRAAAPTGYVVYQGAAGATLDALNASQYNVVDQRLVRDRARPSRSRARNATRSASRPT